MLLNLSRRSSQSNDHVFQVRFAIWDSHDFQLDSTVLLDNLRFAATEAETNTQPKVR